MRFGLIRQKLLSINAIFNVRIPAAGSILNLSSYGFITRIIDIRLVICVQGALYHAALGLPVLRHQHFSHEWVKTVVLQVLAQYWIAFCRVCRGNVRHQRCHLAKPLGPSTSLGGSSLSHKIEIELLFGNRMWFFPSLLSSLMNSSYSVCEEGRNYLHLYRLSPQTYPPLYSESAVVNHVWIVTKTSYP
jgi:hypothetical protein